MIKESREVSELDKKYHKMLRNSVSDFIGRMGERFDGEGVEVLDIAPQDFEGANPYFKKATVETFDINSEAGTTYVGDITKKNDSIPDGRFDVVVCTEVLEHTLQPFDAVEEIRRILKPGGVALVSTPFNFRIHGPLPDCWRFTEHGLRALFKDFEILELNALEEPARFLAPIHYTLVARKKK
ncbi:methyltransferase [Candidatus Saccharibacteria bacterium RIFCSPHIGHO2_02_FULL_47_12]|nr:MAG: methyltransferase [Candidatus Saccharibacteria bacterium RIFCSPHIGHO2_02_FULL_47_12]